MTMLADVDTQSEVKRKISDSKGKHSANKVKFSDSKRSVSSGGAAGAVEDVQERTFVNWCNLFLKRKGFQIKRIEDLKDGVCLILILQNFSEENLKCDQEGSGHENWRRIVEFLRKEDIHIDESPALVSDSIRRCQIITFIVWRIILRFQICDDIPKTTKIKNSHYKKAPKRLLKWIRSMLPNHDVTNFNSDWTSGILMCDLIRSLEPILLPEDTYSVQHSDEINIRLAITTAEDELGVPELFSPYDLARCNVDDKCLMTYLSLIRSVNKIKKSEKETSVIDEDQGDVDFLDDDSILSTFKNPSNRIRHKRPKCVAFGAGLRWGQVGRPSEFFIQVDGPEFSDLSISIECRPFDQRSTDYKPGLEIRSDDSPIYVVKYTPTRPGEYILSVFCSGEHISGSPFRLNIHETVLSRLHQEDKILISFNPTKVSFTGSHLLQHLDNSDISDNSDDSTVNDKNRNDSAFFDDSFVSDKTRNDSAFFDDDELSKSFDGSKRTKSDSKAARKNKKDKNISKVLKFDEQKVSVYGAGLKRGEVGLVSSFQVYTPNYDKGPLAVSITCPAMSIPVPSVSSTLHSTYMKHDVTYLPTEPGVYQLDVTWENRAVPGSPFFLSIAETRETAKEGQIEDEVDEEAHEARISYYRPSVKHNLVMYYSATTADPVERENKRYLERMLSEENPLDGPLLCITMDLEMERLGRKRIFERASTRKLPMVFVNERFVGSCEDIMRWFSEGELADVLLKCAGEMESDLL